MTKDTDTFGKRLLPPAIKTSFIITISAFFHFIEIRSQLVQFPILSGGPKTIKNVKNMTKKKMKISPMILRLSWKFGTVMNFISSFSKSIKTEMILLPPHLTITFLEYFVIDKTKEYYYWYIKTNQV
jgi:hypothetical protein